MADADQLMLIKSDAKEEVPAPGSALLVTNHLNLMYMLAAGLVMPPAGFGDKYYRDTLECFPGWIPLFIDKVPCSSNRVLHTRSGAPQAGHRAVSGFTELSGRVVAIGRGGTEGTAVPGRGRRNRVRAPGAGPAPHILDRVGFSFQSRARQAARARGARRTSATCLRRTSGADATRKALFAKGARYRSGHPGMDPAKRPVPLGRPLAAGGVMAMLFLFGNLGDQSGSCMPECIRPGRQPPGAGGSRYDSRRD